MSRDEATRYPSIPRDRITGVSAPARGPTRVRRDATSDEIELEIRRTRARMSTTLDEIEARLAPARLKRELKRTVHDQIEDVKQEFHPKQMAKRAGDTMLDTFKDHPLATAAAGVSIGYLILKGAEGDGRRSFGDRHDSVRSRRRWSDDYMRSEWDLDDYGFGRDLPDDDYERTYEEDEGAFERYSDRARHRMDEAREGAEQVRHRAEHLREETQRRARNAKERAIRGSRDAARSAKRRAGRTRSDLEEFVYDNPLAAGALAVGIGAILGGLFPSTRIEDRYLGPTRDEVLSRARRVAEQTAEHGKEAGRDLAQEARDAAKDVLQSAKDEALESTKDESGAGRSPAHGQTGSGAEGPTDFRPPSERPSRERL